MDPDLLDLLSAWYGGEIEPSRRDEILARLRRDEAFRRSFVDEIRMLGMLKVVNAAEPRWLRLEDELGWSSREPADGEAFEDRIVRRLGEQARRRPSRALRWAGAAAAVMLLTGLAAWFWPRGPREAPVAVAPRPFPRAGVASGLAMVVRLEGVQWEPTTGPHPAEGDILPAGRLQIRSGRATLSMLSGVVLSVEGPADVELISVDQVFCHRGKLRARVPEGAEGFLASGPGSAILDLGTEFGLNIKSDGKSRGKVFEGEVEVALLSESGTLRRSRMMKEGSDPFEIDPGSGHIEALKEPEGFVAPSNLVIPPLTFDASYPGAILESEPWCYWRFERMSDGTVPNEVPGRPALRVNGPIHLAGTSRDNRCAVFRSGETEHYLEMDGLWEPPKAPGYAIELWFLSEAIGHSALASMPTPKDTNRHFSLVELTSRNRLTLFPAASVRFLHRWPPDRGGGDNLFTGGYYVPYRWHHLVAQVDGDRMETFLDGASRSSLPLNRDWSTAPCQFLLGRLTTMTQSPLHHTGWKRPFAGRMDEVALYNRPLSAEEIRSRHRLATRGDRPG